MGGDSGGMFGFFIDRSQFVQLVFLCCSGGLSGGGGGRFSADQFEVGLGTIVEFVDLEQIHIAESSSLSDFRAHS